MQNVCVMYVQSVNIQGVPELMSLFTESTVDRDCTGCANKNINIIKMGTMNSYKIKYYPSNLTKLICI